MEIDKRDAFLEDRAVAVVHDLMLYLDDKFADVGFGGWMPFRWPDQWLMFCGLMRKVLAANGLVYAKHAETYRKLLEDDDTPEIELPPGEITERIERAYKTPQSWSRIPRLQSIATLEELWEKHDAGWTTTNPVGRGPPEDYD